MRILQLIPNLGMGGAEKVCETLTYELVKLGHTVTVVSLYNEETIISQRLIDNGVKVVFLNKKSGLDFNCIKELKELYKRIKPEVIHTHLYAFKYAVLSTVFSKIKIVHTVHSVASKERDKKALRLFGKLKRVTIVGLSSEVMNTIAEEFGLKKDNIPIVLNGVNFEKCIVKMNYGLSSENTIIHVGRYSIPKNHIELLKAMKILHSQYPTWKLMLVGDGELREKIRSFIAENNMTDYVVEKGVTDNVYPLLAKADIFILPSIYEGIPMTVLEAMGTALPIIASNVGGIPDLINEKNGLLIENPTAENIVNSLQVMIQSEELRESLGRQALADSKKYCSREMARKYIQIYRG